MDDIAQSLRHIQEQIRDFEKKYHRKLNSVALLAASKGQSLEKIIAAYEAKQRLFGENYLQEALAKMAELKNYPDIEWHYIGNVQRNKTRKIAEHFAWVHSVADAQIAQRLNDHRPAQLAPLNICIEVNVSHEASKSGVNLSEILPLANFCQTLPHIRLRGLMTIPALENNFTDQRATFEKLALALKDLQEHGIQVDTLSMGMSADFEAAIAAGTTIVRIGTGIFGKREGK